MKHPCEQETTCVRCYEKQTVSINEENGNEIPNICEQCGTELQTTKKSKRNKTSLSDNSNMFCPFCRNDKRKTRENKLNSKNFILQMIESVSDRSIKHENKINMTFEVKCPTCHNIFQFDPQRNLTEASKEESIKPIQTIKSTETVKSPEFQSLLDTPNHSTEYISKVSTEQLQQEVFAQLENKSSTNSTQSNVSKRQLKKHSKCECIPCSEAQCKFCGNSVCNNAKNDSFHSIINTYLAMQAKYDESTQTPACKCLKDYSEKHKHSENNESKDEHKPRIRDFCDLNLRTAAMISDTGECICCVGGGRPPRSLSENSSHRRFHHLSNFKKE